MPKLVLDLHCEWDLRLDGQTMYFAVNFLSGDLNIKIQGLDFWCLFHFQLHVYRDY